MLCKSLHIALRDGIAGRIKEYLYTMKKYVGIGILLAVIFFVVAGCAKKEQVSQEHIEVVLRKVGHEILLLSNDSTSLVHPIIHNGNKYRIQFEADIGFQPDSLVGVVDTLIKNELSNKHYLVQVQECETYDVVYSFEIKYSEPEPLVLIPCGTRTQPKACYEIVVQFMLDTQQSGYGTYAVVLLLVVLIGGGLFFIKRNKAAIIDDDLIKIGDYQYNTRTMVLIYDDETIELTSKEAELLSVLYGSVNNTIDRDIILNKVWGNEGDYIGRTLDVFISKLRKKLEKDSSIEIRNVRGVGYKLIVNGGT